MPSAHRRCAVLSARLRQLLPLLHVGRGGTLAFSGGDLGKDVGQVRGDGRGGGPAR
jgi:hypothetical protein